jgi:hypothetical protein
VPGSSSVRSLAIALDESLEPVGEDAFRLVVLLRRVRVVDNLLGLEVDPANVGVLVAVGAEGKLALVGRAKVGASTAVPGTQSERGWGPSDAHAIFHLGLAGSLIPIPGLFARGGLIDRSVGWPTESGTQCRPRDKVAAKPVNSIVRPDFTFRD